MASSSAITTRVIDVSSWPGRSTCFGDEAVEQFVLGRLEFLDRAQQLGAVAGHGVGVTLGLAVLVLGEGRLGNQGAQAGVVGLRSQLRKLLVDDRELVAQGAETITHVGQTALDERSGHNGGVYAGSFRAPLRSWRTDPTSLASEP